MFQQVRMAFVVTPYRPQPDGALHPEIPSRGPCANDENTCVLKLHHWRQRKTGPGYALLVARCHPHGRAFTLYPPTYAPYSRQSVAVETSDGQQVVTGGQGRERFAGTVFDAAIDAAAGRAWHRAHRGPTSLWWTTQLRRLSLAAVLVGVAPQLSARRRDQMADVLNIDALTLRDQAQSLRRAGGYRAQGRAVCHVLDLIGSGRFLGDRLHEAGYLGDRWGAPHRWLPELASLRRQPFRSATSPRRPKRPP